MNSMNCKYIATTTFGIFGIFMSILNLIFLIPYLLDFEIIENFSQDFKENTLKFLRQISEKSNLTTFGLNISKGEIINTYFWWFAIGTSIWCIIYAINSILLLIGIFREKPKFMIPYLINQMLFLLILFSLIICLMIYVKPGPKLWYYTLIAGIVVLFLEIFLLYFWKIVLDVFNEISKNIDHKYCVIVDKEFNMKAYMKSRLGGYQCKMN